MKYILSFIIFFTVLVACKLTQESPVIGIQPYEEFDEHLTKEIYEALEEVYGLRIVILPEVKMPETAFIDVKSPRYRADSLLKHLKKNKPDSVDYVLGLTLKDISTTKRDKSGKIKEPEYKYGDWGVMGLGYRPGPSCVISTFRIKIADNELFLERLKKISVHEIGHNLGLKHCGTSFCVMQQKR